VKIIKGLILLRFCILIQIGCLPRFLLNRSILKKIKNNGLKKYILVVAKEDSALGVSKFIDELSDFNLDSLPFFIQPFESLVGHPSLKVFKKSIKYTDFTSQGCENRVTLSDDEFGSLTHWINSSVLIERGSTGRDWSGGCDLANIKEYINDCASYYEWVLSNIKVRAIVDFESDNLIRAVLDIICKRHSIRYFVYYSTRLDGRVTIGRGVISPIFTTPREPNKQELTDAHFFCQNYTLKSELSSDEVGFDKRNREYNILSVLSDIVKNIIFHLRLLFKKRNNKGVIHSAKELYYGGGFFYLSWKVKYLIRRYFDSNWSGSYVSRDLLVTKPYLYFALGQTIEGSEPNFSNGYLNDIICVNLLKSRVDSFRYSLLVKDHRSMIGDRTTCQRSMIDSQVISYVWGKQLTSLEWASNPQSLVFEARAVFTLSGSVGLEALLSNVPVFIFGNPLYKQVFESSGVDFPGIKELEDFVNAPERFLPKVAHIIEAVAKLNIISEQYSLYRVKRFGINSQDCVSVNLAAKHLVDVLKSDETD
jgi:hypothetical protein